MFHVKYYSATLALVPPDLRKDRSYIGSELEWCTMGAVSGFLALNRTLLQEIDSEFARDYYSVAT